ncbi:hypothetical protein N7461_008128 [Penicillium sp. DV-2018c]|nr:hypothetical protein N7461_008128 [Penicillium sp. DV-2018c]
MRLLTRALVPKTPAFPPTRQIVPPSRLVSSLSSCPYPSSSLTKTLPSYNPLQSRNMSSAPAKKEFLCILPDFPGAQAKRLEVRPDLVDKTTRSGSPEMVRRAGPDKKLTRSALCSQHLEGVKPLVASGHIVAGGAMLNSHPAEGETPSFKGSMMLAAAESEAEVRELLKNDIYTVSGVWDLENAQIIPFKSAVRQAFIPTIPSKYVKRPPLFPLLLLLFTYSSTMDIQRQYPNVRYIWHGGISFVYEVHPRIVVKVPKSGEIERQQFKKELEIYQPFSQKPQCPSIVQCFHFSDKGIFLEYMRDNALFYRIQHNHTRDPKSMVVTSVQKLEPLHLRLEWMNDLAQAVAFLEPLNLAHGDLRPENILLDRNRLKLSDFDCTDMIGANYEACMCPYGRLLNDKDEKSGQGPSGTSGFLGPRTEQFSLGSLYYLINYGFEVYGDRCLADDPYEHGPKTVDLLQDMVFPELKGDPMIDGVIDKCWHYGYVKIADLAAHTKTLLDERSDALESNGGRESEGNRGVDQIGLEEDFLSKKEICQELERRGLLDVLSSGEPKEIGFSWDWYRHSLRA